MFKMEYAEKEFIIVEKVKIEAKKEHEEDIKIIKQRHEQEINDLKKK